MGMTITDLDQMRDRVKAGTMTQAVWDTLSLSQREYCRDLSGLSPQLIGLEGWRVEVQDELGARNSRRFIVGKSTGWRPCHLEIHNRRSLRGSPAARYCQAVRKLEKVR